MDSIVEFVGYFYKKGDKFDCSDFDDYLWENPWEDIVENVKTKRDCLDQIVEDITNLVIFKEDCFSMKIEHIVSLFPHSHQSGIEWITSEVGYNEVFGEFREDIIKLGLSKFKEEPPKKKLETLDDIIADLKLEIISKEPDLIRILTVWSFTSYGSGEDTDYEWDLVGTIDHGKIASIIEKLN